MTIKKLHSILSACMSKGLGRYKVRVLKTSFTHPLESDGCVVLDVDSAEMDLVREVDGDGWTKTNADGSERTRYTMVLCGDAGRTSMRDEQEV